MRATKIWRLEKEAAQINAVVSRKHSFLSPHKRKNSLETCRQQLQEWKAEVVKQVRNMVRWLLGNVVRASSLVETVNSWLRPFLWRRKGNGGFLYNLLRFCFSTHRFFRGKRQGKTPLQLAGIEVSTDDWLQLLGFAPKAEKV
jgi:hypothetical protein